MLYVKEKSPSLFSIINLKFLEVFQILKMFKKIKIEFKFQLMPSIYSCIIELISISICYFRLNCELFKIRHQFYLSSYPDGTAQGLAHIICLTNKCILNEKVN